MAIKRARQTLDAAIALIDPVWGGVYQYSEGGSWTRAHFEKIMSFQAQYLRQYSQAYALWKDPKYLAAARDIERYLAAFDQPRRRILCQPGRRSRSRHRRAQILRAIGRRAPQAGHAAHRQEFIRARKRLGHFGTAAYYNVTNDPKVLAIAERAAKWVIDNRALPDGGFRHGEKDRGGPFLGDTLAMGQAFLDLYAATGNRDWLNSAAKAGDFVATFRDEAGGFVTSKTAEGKTGVLAKPAKPIDDQVQVASFMNLLNRYFGKEGYREQAARDALSRQRLGRMMRPLPGILLADEEFAVEPTMTIVGHKDDARAKPCTPWPVRCRPATSAWNGWICARASCPIPTSNIPTSANLRRSPAATASVRFLRSMPRNCGPRLHRWRG